MDDIFARLEEAEARAERAEKAALFLFGLLDNIDTAEDAAKDDDKLFRQMAHEQHRRRFDVATTDGYKVELKDG